MSHIPNNRHNPSISAQHPDSSREIPRRWYDPSRRLLKHLRAYQRQSVRRGLVAHVRRKWHAAHYHLWAIVCGTDIPINTQIGVGLLLPHPQGVVIHPDVTVGVNCLLFQQVTLGDGGKYPGVPALGGHVDVGAGAKILGGVTIGDHAKIGANAVVLDHVPAHATAVGIPARIRASD